MKQDLKIYTNKYHFSTGLTDSLRLSLDYLYKYRWLIWTYIRRDFVAQYRRSFLGIFWAVIMPIVPISVYVLLQQIGYLKGAAGMPRALYVAIGLSLWQLFANTLSMAANRLEAQAKIIQKVKIPLIVVYFSGLGQILFDLVLRLMLIVCLMLWFKTYPTIDIVLFPLLALPLLVLGLGIGMLASLFVVFVSDIKNIIKIALNYGVFASAAIFPLPREGKIGEIVNFNGVFHLIDEIRDFLVFSDLSLSFGYYVTALVGAIFLILGVHQVFRLEERLVSGL